MVQVDDQVYMVTETLPVFPGGVDKMMQFISQNITYPSSAGDEEARVIVRFVVEKDGSITGYEVMRKANPLFEQAAIDVLKLMPAWTPATNGGKPVRCYMTIPIAFAAR